jgi:hypothetical protein
MYFLLTMMIQHLYQNYDQNLCIKVRKILLLSFSSQRHAKKFNIHAIVQIMLRRSTSIIFYVCWVLRTICCIYQNFYIFTSYFSYSIFYIPSTVLSVTILISFKVRVVVSCDWPQLRSVFFRWWERTLSIPSWSHEASITDIIITVWELVRRTKVDEVQE